MGWKDERGQVAVVGRGTESQVDVLESKTWRG